MKKIFKILLFILIPVTLAAAVLLYEIYGWFY